MGPQVFHLPPYHLIRDAEVITLDNTRARIRIRTRTGERVYRAFEIRFIRDVVLPKDRVDVLALPGDVLCVARAQSGFADFPGEWVQPTAAERIAADARTDENDEVL